METGGVKTMLTFVTEGISTVIDWIGTVITAVFGGGSLSQLAPFFAIGISISAILLGVKIIWKHRFGNITWDKVYNMDLM